MTESSLRFIVKTGYTLCTILLIIVVLLIIPFQIWWQFYRYHDCKKVGHTTLYCILSIGK